MSACALDLLGSRPKPELVGEKMPGLRREQAQRQSCQSEEPSVHRHDDKTDYISGS